MKLEQLNNPSWGSTHTNKSKQASRKASNAITKVKKSNSEAPEDDGEVQPGQKCSLVGKEDL